MKGGSNIPENDPTLGNLDQEEVSTNQEGTVIPWFVGERKIALRWISPAMNQFTKEAPVERPGKK